MTPDRDRLLDAALSHVPFEGMNERALIAGARDIGLSADLARVYFPDGGAGLAAAYHRRGDERLARAMAAGQPAQGRIRDRIASALWQRLALSDPELVRAGAATLALPQNAALGARLVWETADTIWTGLGDRSEDVSWWTKRATLASVWGAVVLYWLGDASEGREDTRAFIDRRIEDVMRIEKLKAGARRLPGAETLAGLATGWIRRPNPGPAPGRRPALPLPPLPEKGA
ncbi:COQ9 family protein [Paracoccus contaminans]|uniref:Ubiquinone biosynthesis protein n=1 Tax=Paracoccus contaminans TaxID=1945662 RepID=A0A1W6CW06_9RHOB|nr:COQ9 family protein [Paracoccus contaminans]ARJ69034.1 ubiquinone biosynthesis protein [Paracoccus contaminans]